MGRIASGFIVLAMLGFPSSPAQAAEKVSIYYDVTRSSKMGVQTEYLFSDLKGTASTLAPGSSKERRKSFTIKVKDFGIPLLRKEKVETRLKTMKAQPGRYVWQSFSMGNGNYRNVYRHPTGQYRIKLKEGQSYYLGEFKIVEGMLGGEIAYWTPGNIEGATEECLTLQAKRSARKRKSNDNSTACNLVPALVSDDPIKGRFKKSPGNFP